MSTFSLVIMINVGGYVHRDPINVTTESIVTRRTVTDVVGNYFTNRLLGQKGHIRESFFVYYWNFRTGRPLQEQYTRQPLQIMLFLFFAMQVVVARTS